ncbi:unnamed protein product [Rotaria sp. Silwood1]|nr:unnamed protein product [Rotaria sp. Silwood1]CAF1031056.1 unnamed protein product [Rotaria sp. Silwood1]CAF1038802.1 unnamed protein product [Rotaria sp. Silwood1]CAF3406806.1 unnamed protein product [Rotaria sp. Silwood1]CAF3424155.1 unnamed protein product [Rotaria sp. Silwood1]
MSSNFELEEFNGLGTTLAPRIPNAENRNLESKIETKQRRFQSTQNELDDNVTKVHMLEDHLKNVQDELATTQKLFTARKNEVETEEHMKMLNEREIGRLKQDILRLENEITNIKDRKSTLADEVFRANQLFDEMKAQMKWDQQALEAWLEESAQKDEDVMALMKYTRQDEAKVKELMFKVERMTEESNKKKRAVEGEIMDTTSLQVELDKTASNFRHAHHHRQELIKRWEDIIEQMHQRDRDIDLLAAQLVKIKAEARSVEEQIIEKREFYDNEQRNNNERQLQMSMAERQAAKLRTQYEDAEKNRLLYENELSGLRRVVKRTEKDKENAYALLGQMKKQLTDRRQYLDDVTARKRDLIEKKREILDTKYTAEEKANKMDKLYLDEQEREMKLNSELKLLSERMYKITQDIFDFKAKEKNLEADINGSFVTLNNLQAKTNKLDHEALKQQEVLYHQDFEIQSLERRINRMQGEKSTEEQAMLERKISELQTELQRKRDDHTMLNTQTKQVEEEKRRLQKNLKEIREDKETEQMKIEELELHADNAQRLIKKLTDEKENLLVEEHLMRIELKRLRTLLNSKADNVMNLETRRLQLQTAIKERRSEISIHQSTLRQQLRDEEGKTNEISAQLHDRITKIEKLKKRYEIVNISMAPPEGVSEEETSQTYYVIKAAQEKEELQREGDELDAKNRKAEQELLALQNTLRIINSGNNQTKQSFKKLPDSSDEISRLEELEEQSRHLMDKVRTKRRKVEDMKNDLKRTERALEELYTDQGAVENLNQERRQQVGKLENDVKDMDGKLARADKSIITNKKAARTARNQTQPLIEEHDFELRLLKEFNKKLDVLIDQTVSIDPDAKHCYNMLKEQSHLDDLSSIASTPSSVRSSSTRSSVSQPSRTSSSRQAIPVASVQLGLDGSRPPSRTGQRQQRASSRGSSTASSSSTSSARRVVH